MFKKLKNKILRYYRKLKNKTKLYIYRNFFVGKTKVKKDLILFESMLGRNYSGNPKAIYEEMVKQGLDEKYELVWILEDTTIPIKGNAKKIKRNRLSHLQILCKARVWVFDTRQPNYVVKGKDTIYIMTWHGTPLKKLALDMDDVLMAGNKGIENYKANFWNNSRRWDYLIAQNKFSSNIFKHCFDFHKTMLDIGYPRNDTLINNNNQAYIDAIKEKHGIDKNKKVILYAPTWRDNQSMGKGKYIFNPHINFDVLARALKKDYVFIIKYHYLIASNLDWSRFKGFIYDINDDIQDLYLMADYLMTDYSSVMFDYSVLNKPMIFYTYDLEEYYTGRGFYFDFKEEAPGPFVYDTDGLIELLSTQHDFSQYDAKYQAWHKKYNSWDAGHASEKVVKVIEEVVAQ